MRSAHLFTHLYRSLSCFPLRVAPSQISSGRCHSPHLKPMQELITLRAVLQRTSSYVQHPTYSLLPNASPILSLMPQIYLSAVIVSPRCRHSRRRIQSIIMHTSVSSTNAQRSPNSRRGRPRRRFARSTSAERGPKALKNRENESRSEEMEMTAGAVSSESSLQCLLP
jgi:hypothetical protein